MDGCITISIRTPVMADSDDIFDDLESSQKTPRLGRKKKKQKPKPEEDYLELPDCIPDADLLDAIHLLSMQCVSENNVKDAYYEFSANALLALGVYVDILVKDASVIDFNSEDEIDGYLID